MKKEELDEIIINDAMAKFKRGEIKTGKDLSNYLDSLFQPLVQKMLDAELDCHLEYDKYEHAGKDNKRNGYCKAKKVKTEHGAIEIKTPRDRDGSFNPIIIEKGQTKLEGFEEKCVSLYAKGMSLRDIEETIKEFYGVKINKDGITKLISVVNDEVNVWRNKKLKPLYVFTYADCLYVPIKNDLKSEKKAIYVIIGVNCAGYKEVLGLWIDKTESASFWNNVFEDLKARGVKDILYMSSDGLAGFKNSLETVFSKTQAQRCVVHLSRNIYNMSPKKEAKTIIAGFKRIYSASTLDIAKLELEEFKKNFSKQTKIISKVEDFMQYLEPLYELPDEIRKAIYTSNAVESVNSALRKVTNGKGAFPSEDSVYKVLYLRIKDLEKKWNKPILNWPKIQVQLTELFGQRYTQYIDI